MNNFHTMLSDMMRSLVTEPVTQQYPVERTAPPKRLRAAIEWDASQCTGCGLCATDCPADAIEVIVIDKKAKRFVLRYHADRCTFCAQCVFSCRQGAMRIGNSKWELAATEKDPLTFVYGAPDDIATVLEGRTG